MTEGKLKKKKKRYKPTKRKKKGGDRPADEIYQ